MRQLVVNHLQTIRELTERVNILEREVDGLTGELSAKKEDIVRITRQRDMLKAEMEEAKKIIRSFEQQVNDLLKQDKEGI